MVEAVQGNLETAAKQATAAEEGLAAVEADIAALMTVYSDKNAVTATKQSFDSVKTVFCPDSGRHDQADHRAQRDHGADRRLRGAGELAHSA